MGERHERRERAINIDQVVAYLGRAFARAQITAMQNTRSGRNHAGTVLYKYQVEFSYLVDSIQRGPSYIAPKKIQAANDLIEQLERVTGEE